MTQGKFGRRGAALNGEAIGNPVQFGKSDHQPPIGEKRSTRPSRGIAATIIASIIVLAWLEALLSGTALITPINDTVLWVMRSIGAGLGLAVAIGMLLWPNESRDWRTWLAIPLLPLIFGVVFDGIAWRVADWTSFGFSNQQFSSAQYPVDYVTHGRKGRRDVIEIDPYDTGEKAKIPISDAQYDAIWLHHEGLCVVVQERRNQSGAIEIQTDGQYTMREPATVELTQCGAARAPRASAGANPWSKN